ncbi:MAG: hypothetical protein ACKOCV_04355, partial [Gemmatimonadota bacterium]
TFVPVATFDSVAIGSLGQKVRATSEPAFRYAKGVREAGRGDYVAALATLAPLETEQSEPADARLSALRAAVYGAWVGAIPVDEANAVLRRVTPICQTLEMSGQVECRWADGTLAILAGDRARLDRASVRLLADSSATITYLGRSLRALWAAKQAGDATALATEEDTAMAHGISYSPALPVVRALLTRAARERGDYSAAERYAMWTDAVVLTARSAAPVQMAQAATVLERARSAAAAGDSVAARRHYDRFLAATYPDLPVWREARREAQRVMTGSRSRAGL